MRAIIRVIRQIIAGFAIKLFTKTDVVRYESLQLVADEIYSNNVQGCTAELGVYKGDFASRINKHFYDRPLYLFDTFEGFDERDVKKEVEQGFASAVVTKKGDFTNQNIALVMGKMKFPENCRVKKGWFPESAKDVEEKFVFVSIDADLFEPIYQGLRFFYPLLERGGYIFVHDYNGKLYGAKDAVLKFSQEFGVPYVPISDVCGSVIFTK